jgi:hypothetical protein
MDMIWHQAISDQRHGETAFGLLHQGREHEIIKTGMEYLPPVVAPVEDMEIPSIDQFPGSSGHNVRSNIASWIDDGWKSGGFSQIV